MKPNSSPNSENQSSKHLVSIIIPTYKDADRVQTAIESVLNQTYDQIEIVVVDSSGVDSLEELEESNKKIKYVFQEPCGLAAARNKGIKESEGDVIGFLDADDKWYPEKLEKQVPKIEEGADIIYSDVYIITKENKKRYLSSLPVKNPEKHHIDFLYNGGVPILSVLINKKCFETEQFNEDLHAVEDRNLLARLFASYDSCRVGEPLAEYKQREESMSSDAETMYQSEINSLDHLATQLPNVKNHYNNLAALAEYKYGKRLLRSDNSKEAREHLFKAARLGHKDIRLYLLILGSLFPIKSSRVLWELERLEEALH